MKAIQYIKRDVKDKIINNKINNNTIVYFNKNHKNLFQTAEVETH